MYPYLKLWSFANKKLKLSFRSLSGISRCGKLLGFGIVVLRLLNSPRPSIPFGWPDWPGEPGTGLLRREALGVVVVLSESEPRPRGVPRAEGDGLWPRVCLGGPFAAPGAVSSVRPQFHGHKRQRHPQRVCAAAYASRASRFLSKAAR